MNHATIVVRLKFYLFLNPAQRRCLTASYNITPAATETFSDPIFPKIGIAAN